MSEFLTHLDQWALAGLMILYNLMGVQDIPQELNPHWVVVERWSAQKDHSYRLILQSLTIQNECRQGGAEYILFPQTYEGRQEVFADDIRIYTNELDKPWHLRSVLDRIVINCDLVLNSKKVLFQTSTQIKYYASINSFPYAVSKYPADQFLYDLSYILSATISLFVSFVGTMILYVMNVRHFKLLGLGVAIAMLMLTHVPGYFVSSYIGRFHVVQMLGAFLIAYFYMLGKIPMLSNKRFQVVFFALVLFSVYVSIGFRNTNQFLMLAVAAATLIGGLIYGVFSRHLTVGIRANLLIVFPIALFDVYRAQAYREGYANLAGLVIIVMIFEIINIVKNVYHVNLKTKKIEGTLDSERKLLTKISASNEHLNSVIHDLKAPITSLNFSLQPEIIDKSRLLLISQRFDKIFENLSNDSSNSMADWYPVKTMTANIEEVCLGMGSIFKSISFSKAEDLSGNVYYFIEDFKNTLSEILMNSYNAAIKNSVSAEVNIRMECMVTDVKIYFMDKSGGVNQIILKNLSERGVSTGNSGLGLWMIKNRLSEVGGGINFANKGNGLEVCITYLKQTKGVAGE